MWLKNKPIVKNRLSVICIFVKAHKFITYVIMNFFQNLILIVNQHHKVRL